MTVNPKILKYKKQDKKALFALFLNVLSIGLCLYWYDWKLLIILFIWTLADNILS